MELLGTHFSLTGNKLLKEDNVINWIQLFYLFLCRIAQQDVRFEDHKGIITQVLQTKDLFSRYSGHSETNVSELLENLTEIIFSLLSF